jgi:hypothetical protein
MYLFKHLTLLNLRCGTLGELCSQGRPPLLWAGATCLLL